VPLELDACGDCGAGFLSGASAAAAARLPVVGDMGRMSQGQRLMVGAGIAVIVILAFFVLAEIATHLF
jgi:hypothetical protein